jgi:hypothetical protein
MRRIALVLLTALVLAAPAQAGPLVDACAELEPSLQALCRAGEVLTAPAAPKVSEPEVAAYEASWLHRTLAFQYELGAPLPLRNAPWIGTHNSANTSTEVPTLSGIDANQRISLTDQLRLDVRSLELDVHFVPSVWGGGAKTPIVCHGRGADQLHAGCTTERTLAERLAELRAWLDAHPGQVLLLYLEDHLEDATGYEAGARMVAEQLGEHLYRPPAGAGCTPMPLELTREQVRAAGAQVIAISGCGPAGTSWTGLVFDDAERAANESGSADFAPYPGCDGERPLEFYDAHLIRYFEDSTGLTAGTEFAGGQPYDRGLTPERTRAMARCGVDLFGFDQLVPDDRRLGALVWSWAPGEPVKANGDCTVQGRSGRWRAEHCGARRAFACLDAAGRWSVDTRRGRQGAGDDRCAGATFALPRTGLEAQRLRDAMAAAAVRRVWVADRR